MCTSGRRWVQAIGGVASTIALVLAAGCVSVQPVVPESANAARPPSAGSSTPVGAPAGTSAPAAPPTSGAVALRPDTSTLKPFREVIAGAVESRGWLTVWQKHDKVWIEIPAARLDQPFWFSYNVSDSVGERSAYASQMGRRWMVSFHRVGNAMQLVARNTRFTAAAGTPNERAVRQSFTDSLLASAPVASQPHPERDTVLVDASALLMNDIPGYATQLESSFRMNYALDRANSSFTRTRADAKGTSFAVRTHFSAPRLPAGGAPGPSTPPDARSVFIGFVYNFAPLPEPMRPRDADDRIGLFTTTVSDFTDDRQPTPRRFLVNRWRLEKRDPGAARSDPKEPIVFWIDRNVPLAYRDTIADGIRVWNQAFERIGFSNAIVVRVQPDDADFDTLEARHASVRWYFGADAGIAIGPSHTDPRTGEILDAAIAIPDAFTRGARSLANEALPQTSAVHALGQDQAMLACEYAAEAMQEASFALGLLDARGIASADSEQAERFTRDYLKAVVTHEVGHTLGLTHNFRASTIHHPSLLSDASFTKAHGMSGSVMDYTPFNIAAQGERQGEYVMSGLGPYDYWAIEYAYKPFDGVDAQAERSALARLAARAVEPALAFASDDDAGSDGMDPEINRFDLGSDPLAYYRKRLELSRELWEHLQSRPMKPDESYLVLRRNLERGFNEVAYAAPLIAKYVGGVRTSRHHASFDAHAASAARSAADPSTTRLYVPIEAARQRQALELLATQLFSEASFRFKPDFLARVGVDHLDRGEPGALYGRAFYLPGRVLAIQSSVLDHLLSESVARRIGNAENMTSRRDEVLTLNELYATLQHSVWSELETGGPVTAMRRNLQREHLKRVVGVLLRPSSPALADARSLQRENALALKRSIERALQRGASTPETRAHLRECVATLDDALRATLQRVGA